MYRYLYIIFLAITINVMAQFPPPAGQPGSTALHVDSAQFVDWATGCEIERSYLNISDTTLGFASYGSDIDAIGIADNMVVSLGDGGSAILSFNFNIYNGPGADFAIFENAFTDDYLELAHVEVSSDGVNFYRFPSTSLTDTTIQTEGFGTTDATKINNLAGKYRAYYGTPFDLDELASYTALDINNITYIRIIDVVGAIDDQYGTRDGDGRIINDPWPTPFESSGFDLDAVGVIHSKCNSIINNKISEVILYPNPAADQLYIKSETDIHSLKIIDMNGSIVFETSDSYIRFIDISILNKGFYAILIESDNIQSIQKLVKE
jgi:uncharacterized protein YceK